MKAKTSTERGKERRERIKKETDYMRKEFEVNHEEWLELKKHLAEFRAKET